MFFSINGSFHSFHLISSHTPPCEKKRVSKLAIFHNFFRIKQLLKSALANQIDIREKKPKLAVM